MSPKRDICNPNFSICLSRQFPLEIGDALIQPFEHPFDPTNGPVEVFLLDDERGGEADHVVVGFLAEKSFFQELLAEAPSAAGFGLELDPDEQSPAPDFLYVAALNALY